MIKALVTIMKLIIGAWVFCIVVLLATAPL